MALTKSIPLPFKAGLKAGYLRIDQVSYNRVELVLEIVLGVYMDEAAALGGFKPIGSSVIRKQFDELDPSLIALHDEAGPLLYAMVKDYTEGATPSGDPIKPYEDAADA